MATRYWLNTTGDGDDTNAANYDAAPAAGDDLMFDPNQPGWNGPSYGDGGNGGLAGLTFGTISVQDGSGIGNVSGDELAAQFSCDALYLTGGSFAAISCTTVNAGADGSYCGFYGAAADSGSVFAGYSSNSGSTGNSTTYNDNAADQGLDGDQASFHDNASLNNATIAGTAELYTAGFLTNYNYAILSATSINVYSSGIYINSSSAGSVNVYNDAQLGVDGSELGTIVLRTPQASVLFYDQGVTVQLDSTDIAAGNIKAGVTLLGETGTLSAAGYSSGGNAGF